MGEEFRLINIRTKRIENCIERVLEEYERFGKINVGQYRTCLEEIKFYEECNGKKNKIRQYLNRLNQMRDNA